jgi:hypothetical protein
VAFANWIDWDAFYVRTAFAREREMRILYTFRRSNGAKTYDSIIPYEPFGQTPEGTLLSNRLTAAPTGAYSYEYNPSFSGWWVIHTQASGGDQLEHMVYSFLHEGQRVGVVVEPQSPGRSTFGYETRVYEDENGEDPGSLTLFLVFESASSKTLGPGQELTYSIRYHFGTLAQLDAAGFSVGPIIEGDCSGCLVGYSSCAEACQAVAGTTGHCAWPGSTDPSQCCACL